MGVVTVGESGLVYRGRYDPRIVQEIKKIPGRTWDPKRREWYFPARRDALRILEGLPQVNITPEARTVIQNRIEAEMTVQAVKEEERPEPVKPMPVKVKPFAHQVKGFNIAITLFGWGKGNNGRTETQ